MNILGVLLILAFMPFGIIPYGLSRLLIRQRDYDSEELDVIIYFWPIMVPVIAVEETFLYIKRRLMDRWC